MPLKVMGNMALVTVMVNGHGPYRFVLDTGSETSLLDLKLAEELGCKPTHRMELMTMTGLKTVPASWERLSVGPITLDAIEVLWMENAAVAARLKADGVLGQNFLKRFNYLLDYRHRSLDVTPLSEEWTGLGGTAIQCSRLSSRCAITVPVGICGRTPESQASLVLDSGADCLTLINRKAAEFVRLMTPGTLVSDRMLTLAGKEGRVLSGIVPRLMIAGRLLLEKRVALLRAESDGCDGALPTSLFDSVYFNNQTDTVVLNPLR